MASEAGLSNAGSGMRSGGPGKCSSDMLQSSDDDDARGQITEAEKGAVEVGVGGGDTRTPTLASVEEEEAGEDDECPDGGVTAWLVILGAWCSSFCAYGWVNSVGIFQEYYETGPLKAYTPSQISWIPSLQIFFMSFLGPVVGRLNDAYGPRALMAAGSLLHVLGIMTASLSTEYYQILLSQGVCSGVGVAALFVSALNCVSGWFDRRRGLAYGLLSTGSSLGGVAFPLVIANLLRTVGYGWAMRTCGFVILSALAVANTTVRARPRRGPPTAAAATKLSRHQMLKPFSERAFQWMLLGQFFVPFGLYVPITYLPTAAIGAGMRKELAQNLVTFYNAGSLVGRLSSGILSDKAGKYNVFACACTTAGALVLAMWIPAAGAGVASDAATVAFSVLFGVFSGAYISLLAPLVAQISPPAEFGYRNGLTFLVSSVGGLTTSPIAGAILGAGGNWTGLKVFAGVMLLAGTAITFLARLEKTGYRWRAVF
ncbi:major facilitator superfamily domain-containing protein [Biscogniauxia sp. FL1348]|nr:major facilitator superfamily domain-containing protein [Biscogniauxia sp. FL1348]